MYFRYSILFATNSKSYQHNKRESTKDSGINITIKLMDEYRVYGWTTEIVWNKLVKFVAHTTID